MGFAHIPSIDRPQRHIRIQIRRFDPERDREPRWESHEIPWVPSMTVMQALEWLWDQGVYVAFRQNCREFTCGSCAMVVNGKASLACDTRVQDGMRIEPLSRYPVIKDLVVDTSAVRETWKELELWPHVRGEEQPIPIRPDQRTVHRYGVIYARCIECYSCLDACPASESERSTFVGPMWMLQIARAREHPLDGVDRLRQAWDHGLSLCVNCGECQSVCPVGLSPVAVIDELRADSLRLHWRSWWRRGAPAGEAPTGR